MNRDQRRSLRAEGISLREEKRVELLEKLSASWIVGFTDGEGCFFAGKSQRTSGVSTRFRIAVRDEDWRIVQAVRDFFGFGDTRKGLRYGSVRKVSKPLSVFEVRRTGDCMKLVEFFDRHPLLSKKQKPFQIWRQIVIRRVAIHGKRRNRDGLYRLCEELKRCNQSYETHGQLTLFRESDYNHEILAKRCS